MRKLILAVLLILSLCFAASAEGILPMPQTPAPVEDIETISLHAVTGANLFSKSDTDEGGVECRYLSVSYACYERFSVKLAEEGFHLVSGETEEDGTIHATVSDGATELRIDYYIDSHPNKEEVIVTYPPHVYPRERRYYEDCVAVSDGVAFTPYENVTFTPIGWEKVDYYKNHWYDTLTSPPSPRTDTYTTSEDEQMLLVRFEVQYNRKDEMSASSFLTGPQRRINGEYIGAAWTGKMTGDYDLLLERDAVEGEQSYVFAFAFSLTRDQMAHVDEVAITFTSLDHAVPYVYFLQPPEA